MELLAPQAWKEEHVALFARLDLLADRRRAYALGEVLAVVYLSAWVYRELQDRCRCFAPLPHLAAVHHVLFDVSAARRDPATAREWL